MEGCVISGKGHGGEAIYKNVRITSFAILELNIKFPFRNNLGANCKM